MRYQYIAGIFQNGGGFLGSEWDWLVPENSTFLLRVSGKLTSKQAKAYKAAMLRVVNRLFPITTTT